MKKIRKIAVGLSIVLASVLSFGFADNYFELSKNLDIFSSLFKELNTYYVDDTEPGALMKTAIDGMLHSLDPYTNYIPESKIEDYRFLTTGQYGGIGALIHKDGEEIIVSEPYEDFPAFDAGLRAGDQIISIDNNAVEGKSTSEISKFLKGQPGTSLNIEILRTNKESKENKVLKVDRENIKIKDVPYSGMLNDKVGYIKLIGFTQTASKEFIKAFKDLKEQGMEELVFDLRGNGGGLLIEAVHIVNVFIPKGKLVVETKGKLSEWDAQYFASKVPLDTLIPISLLVDESSASASEIVAGSLQDYDRAVIIGKQTFGKGLVQQTRPLSYNAQLKVTVAKYYIPSGRCIQRIDYSQKDQSGDAVQVPDSAIKGFATLKNKRKVYDSKGIKPDIKTEERRLSPITIALLRNHLIFRFASEYALKHDSIISPTEFQISEEDFEEFKTQISNEEYEYSTRSETILAELKEIAVEEKYFEGAEEEFNQFAAKINADKTQDLIKFKEEIKDIIDNEIISRYYFQNGRIAQSLDRDPDVQQAIQLFQEAKQHQQILLGSLEK